MMIYFFNLPSRLNDILIKSLLIFSPFQKLLNFLLRNNILFEPINKYIITSTCTPSLFTMTHPFN